jgi:2-polyprenyl-6-methoxyphenol hydroxylase-like FAD-dependent oxidoreductase
MKRLDAPRALVVGGSLGGLFAATALRAAGWQADVFERSPSALDSRGGGLVLQPDVLAAFRFAGIDHGVLGVPSDDRIYLDAADRVVERRHMPQLQTSWNLLYGVLHRAMPDAAVHAGERLVSFRETAGRVTALFDSGRVETGDLLVGADGARSTVRKLLLPDVEPHYAGYVAWRGLVPERGVPAAVASRLGNAFAFQQGDGHLLLEYIVPGEDGATHDGGRRRNWVWFRKVRAGEDLTRLLTGRDGTAHPLALPPGMTRDSEIAALRRDAQALLAPSLGALVMATEAPFIQAIVDLGVPRMRFGATVLIGDAAFVPRPHTAGGAAKAAADALSLAQALRVGAHRPQDRLARWEATQLALGRSMSAAGIGMGNRIMGIGP